MRGVNKMGKLVDLTGCKFGRLTVIKKAGYTKKYSVLWQCKCECGGETITTSANLNNGNTKSCGCLQKEKAVTSNITHGCCHERLHGIWTAMKSRCYNPHNKRYKYYGERGISVCDEWSNSYSVFRKWALANGYDENAPRGVCTIDRIDVDGNYEPSNCRWVDNKTNAQNKQKQKHKEG
jgi:hypothetical protein